MHNSAILEPVFFNQSSHNTVITVCVDADIFGMLKAEIDDFSENAVCVRQTHHTVNNMVRQSVVDPRSVVDIGVGRVGTISENK